MKKVTAKHLMIGDWVKHEGSKRSVFNTHLYNDNSSEMWIEVDDKQLMVKSATPIPITEEWLMLNGWVTKERFSTTMFAKNLGEINRMTYITDTNFLRVGENTYYDIQYIHQLQQAYRLATGGKELKIKF